MTNDNIGWQKQIQQWQEVNDISSLSLPASLTKKLEKNRLSIKRTHWIGLIIDLFFAGICISGSLSLSIALIDMYPSLPSEANNYRQDWSGAPFMHPSQSSFSFIGVLFGALILSIMGLLIIYNSWRSRFNHLFQPSSNTHQYLEQLIQSLHAKKRMSLSYLWFGMLMLAMITITQSLISLTPDRAPIFNADIASNLIKLFKMLFLPSIFIIAGWYKSKDYTTQLKQVTKHLDEN
ncbi:MAG: hypothetical protein V2I33_02130 [Kangiellaceae bacterium]|jgi:hypothetical protein|nr:hypothetical protein [Kangiellaceae bacterium]